MSALYIHIPFCKSKCHYCAFNSYAGKEYLYQPYLAALRIELQHIAQNVSSSTIGPLKTIFFGGGTPTVLASDSLVQVLKECDDLFGISSGAEISTEANPETVDENYLRTLRIGGFNRISFGVQSLADGDLQLLGRPHRAQRAVQVINAARKAGFENLNFDLMSGLEGQSLGQWKSVLHKALELGPNHLSVYSLTPEQGTPLYEKYIADKVILPAEEISLEMDAVTKELCSSAGLFQYETSNYAQLNHECGHNINYWRNEPYLAAGAGAVSYVDGCRTKRVDNPEIYIKSVIAGQVKVEESECLDKETSFRETVIIGLRMIRGISVQRLKRRYGIDVESYYGKTLNLLMSQGLVEVRGGYLRLTDQGRPLTNQVLERLV